MITLVSARNIDEAHFKIIRTAFQEGEIYTIDRGSYEGHKRLEFPFLVLSISHPGERPLSPQMPVGIPSVTTDYDIDKYFANYIMDPELAPNETYKYSSYIAPQLSKAISILKGSPGTNQATITIGGIESIEQLDPPCLRCIDLKIRENVLYMTTYWRSWDLLSGLPLNLGGLQLLKEYVCQEIACQDGPLIACSKGAHLYDFQWPVAYQRLNCCMPDNSIISAEEAQQGERWFSD